MTRKVIRLEDIAQELKVSKVTVSKALRNHPDISIEMTQRVKELAEKIGYFPNRHARNLSSHRSRTIGIVVPKIAHFFFASVIEAIYEIAFEKNYEIILMVSQENAEREKKHIESLISMRVDGILISISQNTKNYSIFETVKGMNIPLVFFDRVVKGLGFSCISVNDKKGAYDLIDYVVKSGYTKIGHLGGQLSINIGLERFQGFEEAMLKNGLPINQNWIIEGGFGEKDGYKGFMKIHETGELPEMIFAVTFPVALGVLNAAKDIGVHIPNDVNVVCFGRSDYNQLITPSISCVVQPTKELGKKSFEILLTEIEKPYSQEIKDIVLDTTLEIYDTLSIRREVDEFAY
jgi:LacI family transcriptional regulator